MIVLAVLYIALGFGALTALAAMILRIRSEDHTSELQSLTTVVCRLLLEKKIPAAAAICKVQG